MAKRAYEGDLDGGQLDADFYIKLGEEFKDGLDEGYPINLETIAHNSPDLLARQNLLSNLYAFSGAKTFAQLIELRNLTIDKDGKLRPFNEFKKDALKINDQYNNNWLKTEYNNTVNSSISAANWQRQVADKDLFPFLVYQTAGDSNVRAEHANMDGIKLPIDDPFWNSHYPPNDWGCRCDVISDDDETPPTDIDEAKERSSGAIRNKMFRNNPGKTGIVFKDSHPYFKASKNPQTLKAVDNYGLREINKIYADPTKLSKRKDLFSTRTLFDSWWAKKAVGSEEVKDGFEILDPKLDSKVVAGSVAEEQIRKSSFQFAQELEQVIASPDEIYTLDKTKGSGIRTVYVKYYENNPIVVITEANNSKNIIEVISMKEVNAGKAIDKFRKGVLMHK